MKKFAINYSRKFPDHRVHFDYQLNKQMMKSPAHYLKHLKDGMNATGAKHFHIWLTVISTFGIIVTTFAKYYGKDGHQSDLNKKNAPGYRYMVLSNKGGYGAYDNILQKFQNEEGGIRDLPWNL